MPQPYPTGRLRRLGATCVLTAVLAACGGGGGGDGSAPAAAPASTAPSGVNLTPQASAFISLDLPALPDYRPQLPAHYVGTAAQDNTPAGTVENSVVATLGRVLFYDRQLSVSGTIACASCHNQQVDFGDATRFSTGFDGSKGTMHAMRLANLRYFQAGSMFWDKRAATLETQSTLPVQNPVEMGFDLPHGGMAAAIERLQQLPYYADLFSAAFGDPAMTEERMQKALVQFVRAMVSTNSRWDTAFAKVFDPALADKGVNKPLPDFTDQENRGRHLFMASRADGGQACVACHQAPTFALGGSGSNGLDAGEARRLKSPSLKNVGRSTAFMHDGRFSSLDEVVEHYSTGVQDGPGLDARLKGADGLPLRPNLSQQDKDALVAFLRTLSDPVLAADPKFASPFNADRAASLAGR